jgi:hypothetical protein
MYEDAGGAAVGAGFGLGFLLIVVVAYLFACYLLKRICERAGGEPGILIWIPILQFIPLLQAAGMSLLWIIGFLIPLVNIVGGIMLWANLHIKMGKNPWLTVLIFIPFVNFIYLIYLAFSKD